MKYLSCPLAVEDKDKILNHGLLTLSSFPRNGVLNEAVSRRVMYNAIVRTIPYYENMAPETLPTKEEVLECYGTHLIGNSSLLIYLFMTGRGDEFQDVFGDNDFLGKIESRQFDEITLKAETEKRKTEGKELDSNFRSLIASDLTFIKEKQIEEMKKEQEENFVPTTNRLSKGA